VRPATPQARPCTEAMPGVNPNTAGLDIGTVEIWACVPEDRGPQSVRSFETFTPVLYALADWLAAQVVSRSDSALGAFYRRMRARLGPRPAIVATAHKMAGIVSHMLKHRTPFRDLSAEGYEQRTRARAITNLRKKAALIGLTLMASPA
jgi:hypothetical protein